MFISTSEPTPRQLRVFAATSLVVGAVFFGLAWRKGPLLWSQPGVLWFAAPLLLVGVIGSVLPTWVKWVYRTAVIVTWPIGFVLSHVILLVLYYLILVPIAAALRLTGYDPLQRKPPGRWIPRPARTSSKKRYLRQY